MTSPDRKRRLPEPHATRETSVKNAEARDEREQAKGSSATAPTIPSTYAPRVTRFAVPVVLLDTLSNDLEARARFEAVSLASGEPHSLRITTPAKHGRPPHVVLLYASTLRRVLPALRRWLDTKGAP